MAISVTVNSLCEVWFLCW